MKIIASLLLSAAVGTTAFSASSRSMKTSLRMSDSVVEDNETVEPMPPKKTLPQMSQSLPFLSRPPMLDGSLVGDVGFDPFNFAKTKEDLMNYREAEIKHARLAMLAAAGWPVSELFDAKLAQIAGLPAIVGDNGLAPSVFNGGLGKINPVYWVTVLIAAGIIDVVGIQKSKSNDPNYFPGNFGFDPLGLYPKDKEGQERMQLAELKNGRLGMIAITAFAVQEFVYKIGVVDETPVFFRPIGQVIREYTNSGYYLPN